MLDCSVGTLQPEVGTIPYKATSPRYFRPCKEVYYCSTSTSRREEYVKHKKSVAASLRGACGGLAVNRDADEELRSLKNHSAGFNFVPSQDNVKAPEDIMNIRILPNMVSGIPIILALGTRTYVYMVFWAPTQAYRALALLEDPFRTAQNLASCCGTCYRCSQGDMPHSVSVHG